MLGATLVTKYIMTIILRTPNEIMDVPNKDRVRLMMSILNQIGDAIEEDYDGERVEMMINVPYDRYKTVHRNIQDALGENGWAIVIRKMSFWQRIFSAGSVKVTIQPKAGLGISSDGSNLLPEAIGVAVGGMVN